MARPSSRKETKRIEKRVQDLIAEVLADLEAEGFLDKVPHYTEIASKSLGIGMILARVLQEKPTERLSEDEGSRQFCPQCGREWEVEATRRKVRSLVG